MRSREGHLVVLDERMHRLILFDEDGRKLHEAGGPGSGPGEFRAASGFEAVDGRDVHVLDRGNRRLSLFRLDADSLLHLGDRILQTASLPTDACSMGGSTYLLAGTGSWLVEVLGDDGGVTGGFGELPLLDHVPEGGPRSRARTTLASGRILCMPNEQMVVATYSLLSDVMGFDRAGRLLWRTDLDAFAPLGVTPLERMGRTVTQYSTPDPSGRHNQVIGLLELQGLIVVQLAVLDWIHRTPGLREIDTRFLDPATGREVGRRTDLPQLGEPWGEEGAAFVNEPFPRAATFRVTDLLPGGGS